MSDGQKRSIGRLSMHVSPDGKLRRCSNAERCPYRDAGISMINHKDKAREQDSLKTAMGIFHDELLELPEYHPAIVDLRKRRIPVGDPCLGWIPGKRRSKSLLSDAGLDDNDLLESGLADTTDSGSVALYAHDRLSIGIMDMNGGPYALYARTYNSSGRKYIRSNPASYTLPEYDKNTNMYKEPYHNELFLADRAKSEARKRKELFIVEGQFDALACQYAGIKNTVASDGSDNFHKDTYDDAMELADGGKLIMCFDSDKAGIHGMMTIAKRFPNANIDAVLLPSGYDPCDLRSSMGDNALRGMLDNHRPLADMIAETVDPSRAVEFMAGMDESHMDRFSRMIASRSSVSQESLIGKALKASPANPNSRRVYHERRRWVRMLGLNVNSHQKSASIKDRCGRSERFSVMAGLVSAAKNEGKMIPEDVSSRLPKIFRDPEESTLKEASESGSKGTYDALLERYHELFDN